MDQRSGDGRFSGWIKILAINCKQGFPEFWTTGRENCFCFEQDHPEFPLQEESQSGGTESSERGSVSSRKTDRLHDVRPLSSAWCSWYSIGLCWFILCCSSWRQYSGKGACYGMKIHQKISKPAYQKLKTMVKWSIDQTLRIRNFDGRNERIVTGAVVTKRRGQRGVERGQRDCYRWKAKGRCSRVHKCSFQHDEDKRSKPTPKTASPSEPPTQRGRSASRKKNLRGQSPSGKFARQPCTKSPCDDWHPPESQFEKSESGCRFGNKCSLPHRQVEVQPSKKRKKGGERSDKKAEEGWWQKCSCYCEKCATVGLRITGRWAARICNDFSEGHKSLGTNSTSTFHKRCARAASTIMPVDRVFVVDFGASMHMVSRKDINSAQLETVQASKSPTTVVTGSGEVLTKEEATVYVKELDLFVSNASRRYTGRSFARKLCENHEYNYYWTSGQKQYLIKNGRKINCNTANYVPFVVPGLSTSSSTSSSPTSPILSSQEIVTITEHPASTRSENMSDEVQGNLSHGPADTEKPSKNDDNEEVHGNMSHD